MNSHHDPRTTLPKRDHAFPVGETASGALIFTRGASNVVLRATPDPGWLCQLAFTGPQPDVSHDGRGSVSVAYPRTFHLLDWRRQGVNGALNVNLPWHLEVRGGLAHLEADLTSLRLTALMITGGASDVQVTLPVPTGVVPIRLGGGASTVELIRPAGTSMSIAIDKGASELRVDDQRFGAMGGPIALQAGSDADAVDRYELVIDGAVSGLTIRPAPRSSGSPSPSSTER